jgi:cysteine synthase A
MFALEWCEFCWSVRRLFGKYRIRTARSISTRSSTSRATAAADPRGAHRAHVDRDHPADLRGRQLLGGATDVLQAAKEGRLQSLLARKPVDFDPAIGDEPLSFLPGWLHPR